MTSSISHAEIRDCVQSILTSTDFDTSERNRRFLSYVVEETLAGRPDRIKAYSIATSVFGRDERFDPQVDSIVRIEAGRLRRSLERYYLTSGGNDPIRITIPRGSYVPRFSHPQAALTDPQMALQPPASAACVAGKLRVFVAAFEMEGDQQLLPNFSRGLTRQIIAGLTRFQTITVFCGGAALGGDGHTGPGSPEPGGFDFVLSGGTSLTPARLGIEALLTDARDGQLVWAETYESEVSLETALAVRDDRAAAIVRTLAQPYGVLFATQISRATERRDHGATLEAVAMYHVYRRTFDLELYDTVRLALEEAISRDPRNAEAHACLSQVYSAAIRFHLSTPAPQINPIQRALHLARRAIELSPRMSAAFFSLAVAQWFAQDVCGCFASLETARALNPNDTEILAELGLRLAMRMDWDRAIPLLEEAYARNPALPGTYRVALALWHFVEGRHAESYREALLINAPRVVYQHVLEAISAHALGNTAARDAAFRSLLAIDPAYLDRVESDLALRNLHPDLARKVASALTAADCLKSPPRLPGIRRTDGSK